MKKLLLATTALFTGATINANIDASLLQLDPSTGSSSSYVVLNRSVQFTGIIRNEGTNAITALDLVYSDENGIHTDHISSVNIAPGADYSFMHAAPYVMHQLGPHDITFSVVTPGDNNSANDQQRVTMQGVAFIPVHHVTVEEATGTWCGWCVRGIVYMDSMHAVHPSDADLIAVHDGDPMTYAT
ncbi:MAG TPA: hypothetical protein VL651_04195, partial [Bacteroidia bacterium]|nr:hypothetical protein [Bacteroidia bacterium]